MSVKTIARIIGSVVTLIVAIGLYFFDHELAKNLWWFIGISAAAVVVAFLITPYITVIPYRWMRETSVSDLIAAVIGLIVGLIISVLLFIPLANLPTTFGHILPLVGALVFSFLGVALGVQRKNDIAHLFQAGIFPRRNRERDRDEEREKERGKDKDKDKERDKAATNHTEAPSPILLDTSAIIDGRIADISQTGFVSGTLVVPRFVLNELQHIADAADTMRRNRGRRGLEMLNRLKTDATVPIDFVDVDIEGVDEVDSKLVKMARDLQCPIITNDFNLNRVAELQGVKVLNINELANAVKPVLLPGEDIYIKIMQDGKELGQGVGYLDDGTMIVVEGGRQYMGTTIEVTVTRVLQTVAGRMIFAHPKQGNPSPAPQPPQSSGKQKQY
ncbi:MAG TPA: PIN domain-containing protein [Ktedonobacteraceae bacterium]|nr:PIN domain-containing protein [Ktedonobacteraceae bacterium]